MFCPDENLGMFQIMIINVHLTMTSGQSAQPGEQPQGRLQSHGQEQQGQQHQLH